MHKTGFSIEESDLNMQDYKRIHRSGCSDLRDEHEVVSSREITTKQELVDELDGYASVESVEELDNRWVAPCARTMIAKLG